MDCKFNTLDKSFPVNVQTTLFRGRRKLFFKFIANYQFPCTSMATILSMFLSAKNTAVCFFTVSGAM